MLRKSFLLLICMLSLSANDVTYSQALSLDEALELLQKQNLEIKSAGYEQHASKEDVNIATAQNWGSLTFSENFMNSDDAANVFVYKLKERQASFGDFGFDEFLPPMGQAMMAANNGQLTPQALQQMGDILNTQPQALNFPASKSMWLTQLSYELPIYTGGQISGYTDIAKAVYKIKRLDQKKVIREKVYQLKKSYYDMALLRISIEKLTKVAKNISLLEHTTEQMIKEGYAKKVDKLEVQSKKADIERIIKQMHSNEELLLYFISFLLDQRVSDISVPTNDVVMPSVDSENAAHNSIMIQQARQGVNVHEGLTQVAYSGYLPTLGAFGEVSTADDEFMGNFWKNRAYTVGAQFQWNIFRGGADMAKIEKAKLERLKSKTNLKLAEKGIALQIENIKTQIKTYDYEIESLHKELELANEIYTNYEGRYKEKLVSMNDVVIKQSLLIEKILQLQHVKNKRNERIFALEKIIKGDE